MLTTQAMSTFKEKERRSTVKNLTTMNYDDPVHSPSHYTSGKFETIDYIEDKLTSDQFEGYCVGNILKYMSRYRHKNGVEDLQKAKWYLTRLINFKASNTVTKT